MKNYILVHQNYDGVSVEKFDNVHKMCDRATEVLKPNDGYESRILFSGSVLQEFTFEPVEVVTKHKAVEIK